MIVQVGSYPPPIGGISIYIKRMKDFLDLKGIENQVWDYSGIKKKKDDIVNIRFPTIPILYALKKDVSLIHYNICGTKSKNYIGFFNRFLFKNRKKIITIHGNCKGLFTKNRGLIVKSLNSFNAIICVKSNDKEFLLKQGISSDIYEIPAFIPPIVKEKEIAEISPELWNFINSHRPIISANASNIVFQNGQDLYGIDMCVDLCANLKLSFPKAGLVFCLPCIEDYKYFEKIKERIITKGIENNFFLNTKPCQLYPIIMKSDVFVRPTNTDGDAVSVRESLHFKIPTVASDVVPRPPGVILFKNREIDDFTLKVKDIIENYNFYKRKSEETKVENNSENILKIYQKLTN